MSGIDVQTTCHFNDGVECAGNDRLRCRTCGWFPPEAERRRAIGRKEFEERAHANAMRRKPVVEGANENEGGAAQ